MSKEYFVQLGIAVRIPMAFKQFCDENYFILTEEKPDNYSELTEREQKICLSYFIQDQEKKILATFRPSGIYECIDKKFQPIFDRIVEDLYYAAYKANQAQDELHRRMTEEFERNMKEKSDKSCKFS